MSIALAWAVAAMVLSASGMVATGVRSSLLILGEEGLSEAAERGNKAAAKIRDATRDPSLRFPFSLWVGATFLKVASALSAGCAAAAAWHGMSGTSGPLVAVAWTASYLVLVFLLENIATRQGLAHPEKVLRGGALTLRLLRASALPAALVDAAGRFFFPGRFSPEALMDIRFGSEEGILTVIEEGAEHGTIDPAEGRMIEGILRFGNRTVLEEMTPRSQVVFLRQGAPLAEVARIAGDTPFSRYPVLAENGEEVVGVLPARSLFLAGGGVPWDQFLEKPVYVPESMHMADLFRRFERVRTHMAIVIDEHGMLCGVITVDDLLEKILGKLAGEEEAAEVPVREKDGALTVPASIPVRELRDEYGIDIPLSPVYETAGGFAMDCLQDIPEGRVTFRSHGYRITVVETEGRRIRRLRFEKVPPTGT
ncbi:MAG: HlyC/CorC family transporter [Deltaproteobacteria bacterium]|nr:HlyC/CorC family transporter [Deltaproteobacteria bacterium]